MHSNTAMIESCPNVEVDFGKMDLPGEGGKLLGLGCLDLNKCKDSGFKISGDWVVKVLQILGD